MGNSTRLYQVFDTSWGYAALFIGTLFLVKILLLTSFFELLAPEQAHRSVQRLYQRPSERV